MADSSSTLECPVCSEVFTDPKLLNCNHIVCGPCIVSWLRKAGPNGGCPLCRSSILPSLLSSSQDDLQAVVDDLPTDLTMVMRVKSFQLLNSRHLCMSCDNTTTAATSVCLQCSMKLCQACSQAHTKFPAMKNHVLEPLDNLTVERLNRMSRTICKNHSDRQAELYCCSHQELMCSLCFPISHRLCAEVKTIEEAATERREMRKVEAERLREKEAAMRTQIKDCREKFIHMRAKAKEAFDDLQQCVEKRREEAYDLIQAEEDKVKVPLAQLDHARAATMSQAGVMDDVVESASDNVLLDMEKVMTSKLQRLEQQPTRAVIMQDLADIQCDPQELTMLKTAIAALSMNAPHSLMKRKIQPRNHGGYRGPDSWLREQQQRVISPQQETPKQETVSLPAPWEPSPKATPPASVSPRPPSTSPASVVEVPQEAAASAVLQVEVTEPVASAPETEVAQPPAEVSPEPELTVTSAVPEPAATPAEVVNEPAPEVPLPTPKDEEQEAAEEVAAAEAAEVEVEKQNGEVAETDLMDIHTRLVNGLGLNYKEGQWSPLNPEGKKQYDREFLLKLQANPESRKAPDLPHMPEIIVDPRLVRMEDFQRAQMAASRSVPDFTPGFFKSYTRSGPSLTKRNSQQRGRGGPGSQSGEQQQQRIIISTRQEVQLHKSENAYKPQFQTEADLPVDEKELKDLQRKFQSILNKLTPEKFSKLVVQALEMKIDTEERLTAATNLIFEKAIAEQKFAAVYADFCRELLKLPKVLSTDKEREVTFRGVLLTKCQKEFEKDKATENALENKKKELESALASNAPQEQTNRLKEELEMETKKARYRSMGNIRFIGELFRLKMLTENIMHDCIFKLLKTRDDDSMECLTKLLDTVGADLDHTKAKVRMDQYFVQFEKMTADMRGPQGELGRDGKSSQTGGAGSQSSKKDGAKLSSRVKFAILDIIDLRKNNWVKRRIHDQNKPTTLGAIHQKAKEEEQAAQFLNSQPRQEPSAARGGARPKGRGSAQGDMDGWNTVPPRQVKQQIEPTRMKLTKTNVDVNNLTLGGGNKFQNWGRGSQGGGSRSQEQEKMANRYTALNNLADSDSRRGYGRSPARGDARGSGRMDRDLDRRDRDRDRDYRKPVARSSMEERERAVASTRNMLGAVGGSSNPSSRNASRDNSRSRDTPPEGAAKKVAAGLDVKKMSETELNRRIDTITEEFINNQAFQETLDSIAELENLDHSMLIMTMLEKLVERTGSVRRLYGQFLFHMVRERQLSVNDLLKGLEEFLQVAEDLELDVPKIWDYLAEVMAGLVGDNKVVPLDRFLKECMRPLVAQGRKKEVYLVTRILKQAADYKSKDIVQTQWGAAGLKLTDFGLSETELSWLKGQSRIYEEIYSRLQQGDSNDEIAHWIDRCIKSEEKESNQFVRELFSAICRNSIVQSGDKKQVNVASLKNRVMLVRKFVDTQEKGTQALFGVQHLMNELQHPPGIVRTLFEQFYDEDMISEESFFGWESREDAPEDKVGKGVVKMNLRSFFEWLRSSNDDERTS